MAHQRIFSSMFKKLEKLAGMVAQPLLYCCMEHLENTLTSELKTIKILSYAVVIHCLSTFFYLKTVNLHYLCANIVKYLKLNANALNAYYIIQCKHKFNYLSTSVVVVLLIHLTKLAYFDDCCSKLCSNLNDTCCCLLLPSKTLCSFNTLKIDL